MSNKLIEFLDTIDLIKNQCDEIKENISKITFIFKNINDLKILPFKLFEHLNGTYAEQFIEITLTKYELNNTQNLTLFDNSQNDFRLPTIYFLCGYHLNRYQSLYKDQQEEYHIDKLERLNLLKEIAYCESCNQSFGVQITILKNEIIKWYLKSKIDITIPTTIDFSVWLNGQNLIANFGLYSQLKRKPRPNLILFAEDANVHADGFRHQISLRDSLLKGHIKDSLSILENNSNVLDSLILKYKRHKDTISGLFFYPPEYWIDKHLNTNASFHIDKKELHMANKGFLLSIIWVISEEVRNGNEDNKILFTLNKELELLEEITINETELYVKEESVVLETTSDQSLFTFYNKVLNSNYIDPNIKIMRDSIIIAGDEELLSVVSKTSKLLRYFDFQYDNLFQEKIKERTEIVKSLVTSSQSVRGKIVSDIGDMNKQIIELILVFLGFLVSLIVIYGRSSTGGYDFAVIASILLITCYIPLNIFRLLNIIYMGNNYLKNFYKDFNLINRLYKYNFEDITNVQMENSKVEKSLKNVGKFLLIFLCVFYSIISIGVFKVISNYYDKLIIKKVFSESTTFIILVILMIIYVILTLVFSLVTFKTIDDHKKISVK